MEDQLLSKIDVKNMDPLATMVMDHVATDLEIKRLQDRIFIQAAENIKGVYGPNQTFSGSCKAFAKITRPRVMHAVARLMEAICPPGEDFVTFDTTPKPSMPELESQLQGSGLSPEDIAKSVKIASDQASVNFSIVAADALEETQWSKVMHDVVYNMVSYGPGILHGPLAASKDSTPFTHRRALTKGVNQVRPEFESIHPFEFIPEAGCFYDKDLTHATIRKVVSKSVLQDWSNNEELFNVVKIRQILAEKPTGDWVAEEWEKRIFNANSQDGDFKNKYIVYVWWGFLSGTDLREANFEIKDEELNLQVVCQIWVCNKSVISIRPSTLFRDRLPFFIANFSKVDYSIFGMGLPEAMFDSQDAYNACERAKYDSIARSCGAYAEVNVSRLVDPKDIQYVNQPNCVIRTQDTEFKGHGEKAVNYFHIPNMVPEIEAVQAKILLLIQDQINLPNILLAQGSEGSHNRTLGGAAMQFNSAITPMKGIIMNIEENIIIPAMQKVYEFFTTFSDDESIRGDIKVVAKGVSGLVAREVFMTRLDSLLARAAQYPAWAEQIDMNRVGSIAFKQAGLAYERLTYTPKEVEENRQKQAEMEREQEIAKAQGMSQIRTEEAKQRAETSPSDMLLQIASESPEGSPSSFLAMRDALQLKGIGSPELMEALSTAAAASGIEQGAKIESSINPSGAYSNEGKDQRPTLANNQVELESGSIPSVGGTNL